MRRRRERRRGRRRRRRLRRRRRRRKKRRGEIRRENKNKNVNYTKKKKTGRNQNRNKTEKEKHQVTLKSRHPPVTTETGGAFYFTVRSAHLRSSPNAYRQTDYLASLPMRKRSTHAGSQGIGSARDREQKGVTSQSPVNLSFGKQAGVFDSILEPESRSARPGRDVLRATKKAIPRV